jgi:tetratricopeptide (TPR) repeat protein
MILLTLFLAGVLPLSASETSDLNPWQAIEKLIQAGQLTAAEARLEPFLKRPHPSGEAYNLNGQILVRQDRFSEAAELFARAIQSSPKLKDAYENLALLNLLLGKSSEAEKAARALLQLDPGHYNARLVVGITACNQGHFAEALTALKPLLGNQGARDPLVLALGFTINAKLGKPREAARLHSDLSKISVASQDALLAVRLFSTPELRQFAVQWLENAQVTASSYKVSFELGNAYSLLRKWEQAETVFQMLLAKNPTDARSLIQLASAKEQLGDTEGAGQCLVKAKAYLRNEAAVMIQYGLACINRRLFFDAREVLLEVLKLQPDNRTAQYLLGVATYSIRDYEMAECQFRAVLRESSQHAQARLALGILLLTNSQIPAAQHELLVAAKVPATAAQANYYLAHIRHLAGEYEQAKELLQVTIQLWPSFAVAYADLAGEEMALGNLEAAHVALDKALGLDRHSSKAHHNLGILLQKQGMKEEAKAEILLGQKLKEEEIRSAVSILVPPGITPQEAIKKLNR